MKMMITIKLPGLVPIAKQTLIHIVSGKDLPLQSIG